MSDPELWTTCGECDGTGRVEVATRGGFRLAECPLCNFGRVDCRPGVMRVPRDEAIKRMAAEYGLQMGGDGAAYSLLMEAVLHAALGEDT